MLDLARKFYFKDYMGKIETLSLCILLLFYFLNDPDPYLLYKPGICNGKSIKSIL